MAQKGKKRDPKPYLPLTPQVFQVLLSLADGNKHGYGILKEVRSRTRGEVVFNLSTLYGIIQRLESEGIIAEAKGRPEPALDDSRRRYFCLTEFGRDVAAAELNRLEDIVGTARAKQLRRRKQPA